MASDNRQFDPRFDRAFQPGFDDQGSVSTGLPLPFESPLDGAPQRQDFMSVGGVDRPAPADREHAAGPTPQALASVADLRAAMDASAPSLKGNPWLRALWVISGVFVVAGIAATAYSQQPFSSGGGAFTNLVRPSLLAGISSWLILSGLLAGISAVMLHAVRWRPPAE